MTEQPEIDVQAVAEKLLEHIQAGTFARPLLSVKGLAAMLDVSPRKAAALIAGPDPEIPSFKVDGSRRVDPREVDRYIERQKNAA